MTNPVTTNRAPNEALEYTYKTGVIKVNNAFKTTLILAVLAGIYIAIGALVSTKASVVIAPEIAPLVSAFMFTSGITLVLIAGAELFTGNILIVQAWLADAVSGRKMIKNWAIVYVGNLIGAILISFITHYMTDVDPNLAASIYKSVENKVSLSFIDALGAGYMCNILVCLGVWLSYTARDGVSKFVLSAIPVMVFIMMKYEHSVANMFYFSFALIDKSGVTFSQVLHNMIPVTIGNILGGASVAACYYFAYYKFKKK